LDTRGLGILGPALDVGLRDLIIDRNPPFPGRRCFARPLQSKIRDGFNPRPATGRLGLSQRELHIYEYE
jgi:hypothetical protein